MSETECNMISDKKKRELCKKKHQTLEEQIRYVRTFLHSPSQLDNTKR